MADLPRVSRRLTVTPQIESRISGEDIARPFNAVAGAIGAIGATIQDYEKSVSTGYIAREALAVEENADNLAIEANGDPAVFDKAMKEYRRARVAAAPAALRKEVDLMVEKARVRGRGPLMNAKLNADTKQAEGLAKARIEMLDDQLATLARNGEGAGEEYTSKSGELRGLYYEIADNPAFTLSREEADISLRRMESRHLAEGMVGTVRAVYARDGMAAAEKAADAILTDKGLDLSLSERRQYSALALSDIRDAERERRAELRLYRPEAMTILQRLKIGEGLDDPDVDEAIRSLGELGDPVLAGKLIRARANGRFVDEFRLKTDAEQLEIGRQAFDAGVPYVDRVVQIESGGNPSARTSVPGQTATGLGGFTIGTWGEFLADRHPDLIGSGQDWRLDPELSKEAIGWYAEKNTTALQAAGFEPTSGNLYLAHFLGGGGAVAMLSADSVRTAASIDPAAAKANPKIFYNKDGSAKSAADIVAWADRKMGGAGAPALDPEALKAIRTEITADAKDHWTSIEAGFKKGMPPAGDELREFASQVSLIEDDDFRQQVADSLKTYAEGYLLGNLPPAEAEEIIGEIRAGAGDDGFSRIERDAIETFQQARDQAQTAIAADPVGYALERRIVRPPPPLDFTPDSMAPRERNAAIARESFAAADVPVFTKAEAQSFAGAVAQGGPGADAAMAAIANVSDASLAATLSMAPVKDAITGAVRSTDPQKFSSAMTALDSLWARAPETVAATFGDDVVDAMQDWQAKLRYYTPDELVNELKARGEPAVMERRRKLESAGSEIARKQNIDELMASFDPGYFQSQPAAPIAPLTRDQFMSDYDALFASRYAATLDEATAREQTVQRMRGKWYSSGVNGGRLTYLPPETAYNPVDGHWGWMRDQLVAYLSTFGNEPLDFQAIGDRTSDADRQAGRPVSYLVAIKRAATGEWDLVRNADGTPLRYRWDATRASADAEAKFKAERDRIFGGARPPVGFRQLPQPGIPSLIPNPERRR